MFYYTFCKHSLPESRKIIKKQIYIIFRFVYSYYIPNRSLLVVLLLPEISYIKRLKEIGLIWRIFNNLYPIYFCFKDKINCFIARSIIYKKDLLLLFWFRIGMDILDKMVKLGYINPLIGIPTWWYYNHLIASYILTKPASHNQDSWYNYTGSIDFLSADILLITIRDI
jgi:hypothetical protein